MKSVHFFKILMIVSTFLYPLSTNAEIKISTIPPTDCSKADGKAEVSVNNFLINLINGFSFEYSKDGTNFQASGTFENLSAGNYTATVREKNTQCTFSKNFTIESGKLNVMISGNNGPVSFLVCSSAPTVTLSASASGGSGNYNYTWPGGTTTVSSTGNYEVKATDQTTKCEGTASALVLFVPIICSRDPNDIIGPVGYGPSKMIAKSKTHPYMIRFENDPDFATAPAQVVKINHMLDSNVNLFSLRLGDFGFGGLNFTVPADKTFYTSRLNAVDSLGVVVDVTAGIDATKREVFWIFESKDPKTGLPPTNAKLGFLPVNDSSSKGEGYVNYTIKAANGTQTGDSIRAKASIVFDLNAPIETPVIFNIIDAVAPVSLLKALPASTDSSTITLSWSGQDDAGGSGIRDYDVYVSENGASFKAYQKGITETSTSFTGTGGSTYCFFTLANDNVGNQEAMKSGCDATVKFTQGSPLPIQWLYVKGQLVNKDVLLNWATISEKNAKSFIIERSLNGTQFSAIGEVAAKGNTTQTSNYQYIDKDAALLNVKLIYYRLRQVDKDGSFTYSIVIAIPVGQNSNVEPIVKAYPNPFNQIINLQVLNVTATKESDHVTLYSLDGKALYSRKLSVQGNTTVLLQDLPDLKQGVYFLKASINEKLFTIKMIKL